MIQMNKPKEFWLKKDEPIYFLVNFPYVESIHVIEYSAYEQLLKELNIETELMHLTRKRHNNLLLASTMDQTLIANDVEEKANQIKALQNELKIATDTFDQIIDGTMSQFVNALHMAATFQGLAIEAKTKLQALAEIRKKDE